MATGKKTAAASTSDVQHMPTRPLSPHLFLYRFGYTMALSILHRITGIALAVGFLVLAWWLVSLAAGHDTYQGTVAILGAGLVQVLLGLWLFAFVYHFMNGIRHLCWDFGWGLEKHQARRSAAVVVAAVVVVSAFLVLHFFVLGGA